MILQWSFAYNPLSYLNIEIDTIYKKIPISYLEIILVLFIYLIYFMTDIPFRWYLLIGRVF